MENKIIPTAEEFLKEAQSNPAKGWTARKAMIEFAKLHVEAALKHASELAEISNKPKFPGDYNLVIDEDSILNSYPLENIK
jgi:hypothetical protein